VKGRLARIKKGKFQWDKNNVPYDNSRFYGPCKKNASFKRGEGGLILEKKRPKQFKTSK